VRARGELDNYPLVRPGNDPAAVAEEWDHARPYGVTQAEFARRLGLHQSTVSRLLARARAADLASTAADATLATTSTAATR
jgi:plasmid maintenance system antidote protein VapI